MTHGGSSRAGAPLTRAKSRLPELPWSRGSGLPRAAAARRLSFLVARASCDPRRLPCCVCSARGSEAPAFTPRQGGADSRSLCCAGAKPNSISLFAGSARRGIVSRSQTGTPGPGALLQWFQPCRKCPDGGKRVSPPPPQRPGPAAMKQGEWGGGHPMETYSPIALVFAEPESVPRCWRHPGSRLHPQLQK